jgi:hypothetical protein
LSGPDCRAPIQGIELVQEHLLLQEERRLTAWVPEEHVKLAWLLKED